VSVVESRYALADPQWVYENPKARADDLMECFLDDSIDGIVATIGGDDSIRLLPYLDLDVIRQNPKVFLGYSDTTVCHLACCRAGIVSFYGPSIMSGFAENGGMFPYMQRSVERVLFQSEPIGVIEPNLDGWTVEHLDWSVPGHQEQKRKLNPSTGRRWLQGRGKTSGHLLGGCLEVLDWLRGTDYWPSLDEWEGAILFLETSEEAPSTSYVNRFLRSLDAMGILRRLNGLLFGRPGGQLSDEERCAYAGTLVDTISGEAGYTELPIITNMDFGHTDPMMTLPYGMEAEIDCDNRVFSILESGVLPE
jgi:muramoyltetrapeptide carboxypeptidase LdcA involved in peptidoglycan recycling